MLLGHKNFLNFFCVAVCLFIGGQSTRAACLVSQYNFSGNANDSKGTNHGTVFGATLTSDRFGNANSAYNFVAASSNYISLPASQFLNQNYSYSLWVKPSSNPSSGSAYIYFSVGSNGDQNMQIENAQNNGPMGNLTGFTLTAYSINSSNTVSTGGVASGTLPSTNKWYHVVCTRDSSYFKVYVNGCLVSTSASYSGTLPYYGTGTKVARIGCRSNGTKFFNGALDDVSVFSCALTPIEVSKLYHAGETFKVARDTSICADVFNPFVLKASSKYCSYKWIDISNRGTILSTDSLLTVNITSSKTYRVFNNQLDSLTVKVTILPKPKLNLGNDTAYCGPFTKTLDAGFKFIKKYLWNNSSVARTLTVNSAGWYGVLVTDSNGCKARDSIHFVNNPLPISSLQNDTLICGSFSYALNAGGNAARYKWDNNDTTQYRTVGAKGKYKVKLTSNYGCITNDSISIKNPIVHARFKYSNSIACLKTNIFKFKDTSLYTDDNWSYSRWTFGDGTSFVDTVASKRYLDTGIYYVKLLIQSALNCKDSLVKSFRVLPSSNIDFRINTSNQCFNSHSFNFTNYSNGNGDSIVSNNWLFGDNSNSNSKSIQNKKYSKDSTYTVQLITTTARNCYDTLKKNIVVYPNPMVDFSISKTKQCFNNHSVSFGNKSRIRTGKISKYYWDLGDGTNAQLDSIVNKKYNTHDTFKIRLIAESDNKCYDTLEQSIIVFPNSKADFSINNDTQCFEWNRFDFLNKSSIDLGTISYSWKFGDNDSSHAKDTIGKIYKKFGNYTVTLICRSNLNCYDTVSKNISVFSSPIAGFTIDKDKQCFRGNVFNFTGTSGINNGSIVKYDWTMGDMRTNSTKNILGFSYNSEDTFGVQLVVKSDLGCLDTTKRFAITFAQPNLKFSIPNDSQCWQKNYFNIQNQTSLKYGSMSHTWDFGDGTFDYNYVPKTKKYANASASYIVKYKVVSDHACSDSGKHRIVLLERPIANILVKDSIQCFRNHLFTFNNNTVFSAMKTVSYRWDYGNGNKSTGFNPQTAVYPKAIYYPVQLIAYSYLTNCYDTTVQYVLPAPHPISGFKINADSQCFRNNSFLFTNQTAISMGATTYKWDFGDLSNSSQINPVKSYNKGNTYSVKLIASSNHNCKDSISKNIVLVPHPKSQFLVNDTAQCLNQHSFDFTNISTIQYGSFNSNWIFDNGLGVLSSNISNKKFNAPGFHEIKLALTSNFSCKDTISRMVYLENHKSTQIQILSKDSQCLKGNLFNFSSTSNNLAVQYQTYSWRMGDASSFTTQNISKKYNAAGTYSVLLETISKNTCKDSAFFNVVVHPQANLSFAAGSPCFPDPVVFSNLSTVQTGAISTYMWDFGDGVKSGQINPQHTYANPGKYSVQVVSVSNYNCMDTLNQTNVAYVRKKPNADFTFVRLPDKQFDVATLKFQNLSSSNIVKSEWNFGDGNRSNVFEPEQDFVDTFERNVQLIVTNDEACTDTVYKKTGSLITDFVFYLPDAFSPDDNAVNDCFKPVATPYVRKYVMEIFNQWGEMVYTGNDITAGWDGRYQNQDCPQGIYLVRVYLVPMRGKIQSHHQTVTLLR